MVVVLKILLIKIDLPEPPAWPSCPFLPFSAELRSAPPPLREKGEKGRAGENGIYFVNINL
jgi:hypothetical protein